MNYLTGDILRINEDKSKKLSIPLQNLVSIKCITENIVILNEYNQEFIIGDFVPVKLIDNRITNIYLDMVVMAGVILPGQEKPKIKKITLAKLLTQEDFLSVIDSGEIEYVHQFQRFLIEMKGKNWILKPSFQLF